MYSMFLSRTKGVSKNLQWYRVKNQSLEPSYRQNEVIVVDLDIVPQNGDEVVFLHDDVLQVGKFREVDGSDYIDGSYGTILFEEAVICSVIIDSFMDRRQGSRAT